MGCTSKKIELLDVAFNSLRWTW